MEEEFLCKKSIESRLDNANALKAPPLNPPEITLSLVCCTDRGYRIIPQNCELYV